MTVSSEYMEFAKCKNNKEIDFYAEDISNINKAVAFCSDCPVLQACLQYALENKIDYGVWGGQTAAARIRMRKNILV